MLVLYSSTFVISLSSEKCLFRTILAAIPRFERPQRNSVSRSHTSLPTVDGVIPPAEVASLGHLVQYLNS